MIQRLENLLKLKYSHNILINSNPKLVICSRHQSTAATKSSNNGQSAQYCIDLVKNHDYENFLATLLLSGQTRRSAFALRAFNVEVSKISSQVSNDQIGIIRLKFWYDAIEELYNPQLQQIRDHPVLKELKLSIDNHKLSKLFLLRLIKSRERPSNLGFVMIKDLEKYSEESVSPIYYLLAKVIKCENLDVDHAASHIGKAQGIVNLLRAQRHHGRSRIVIVPQEILIKHGASHERILRDRTDDVAVQEAIFDVASIANSHLIKARNLSDKVPANVRKIFLPAIAVGRYLERLRKVNFHLSHVQLMQRDAMLPFAYYWNKLRRRY